jgi:hypothetical protein
VAVLSCRPKLEMEDLFDATIPKSRRYKTRFVFRQVSESSLLCTHPRCVHSRATSPHICAYCQGMLEQDLQARCWGWQHEALSAQMSFNSCSGSAGKSACA